MRARLRCHGQVNFDAADPGAEAPELFRVHTYAAPRIQDPRAVELGPLLHQRKTPLLPGTPNVRGVP
jgi:hypothetical protein